MNNSKDLVKIMNKIIKKTIIWLVLCLIISAIVSSFYPEVSASIAVGQLNGDGIDYGIVRILDKIKGVSYFAYLTALFFYIKKDVKKLISLKNGN